MIFATQRRPTLISSPRALAVGDAAMPENCATERPVLRAYRSSNCCRCNRQKWVAMERFTQLPDAAIGGVWSATIAAVPM